MAVERPIPIDARDTTPADGICDFPSIPAIPYRVSFWHGEPIPRQVGDLDAVVRAGEVEEVEYVPGQ